MRSRGVWVKGEAFFGGLNEVETKGRKESKSSNPFLPSSPNLVPPPFDLLAREEMRTHP